MKLHSIFLRKACILPESLHALKGQIGDDWSLVEEITAAVFDAMIRQLGWHFLWVHRPCTGRGFGLTQEDATRRALTHALNGVARRFNAAELIADRARKYPGFHVANVTLQPRQIQQFTWLEIAEDWHRLAVPAR